MTDELFRKYIYAAKARAVRVGSMHALWDTIFDAEAALKGSQALKPRAEIEDVLILSIPLTELDLR